MKINFTTKLAVLVTGIFVLASSAHANPKDCSSSIDAVGNAGFHYANAKSVWAVDLSLDGHSPEDKIELEQDEALVTQRMKELKEKVAEAKKLCRDL